MVIERTFDDVGLLDFRVLVHSRLALWDHGSLRPGLASIRGESLEREKRVAIAALQATQDAGRGCCRPSTAFLISPLLFRAFRPCLTMRFRMPVALIRYLLLSHQFDIMDAKMTSRMSMG